MHEPGLQRDQQRADPGAGEPDHGGAVRQGQPQPQGHTLCQVDTEIYR